MLSVVVYVCSVVFSYLGRDFYNALSERDVPGFRLMIIRYLAGFVLGIPVFVYSDYLQVNSNCSNVGLACNTRAWAYIPQSSSTVDV